MAEPLRVLIEDQPALARVFWHCIPRGCFAEPGAPEESEVAALARRAEAAKLDFRDADGGVLSISFPQFRPCPRSPLR